MATLLPLLLLLFGSAGPHFESFQTSLQQVCNGHTSPGNAAVLQECPAPPCQTASDTRTLTLPVLLSLDTRSSDSGDVVVEQELYDAEGYGVGMVLLFRERTAGRLLMLGKSCDTPAYRTSIITNPASGGEEWMHVEMVTGGQEMHMFLPGHEDKPLSLTFKDYRPSQVKVLSNENSRHLFGYSMLSTPHLNDHFHGHH